MGLSFGYNANEGDDKLISVPDLISLLVGTVANNGNLLLNIGPKADGTIPEEQVRRLKILGAWLKVNHDGIYGTRCSDRESELLESGIELHYTQKDGNLNVFADHLKEGANEFLIKGYHGQLRPFDPAVKVETEDTAEGLLVKILWLYMHRLVMRLNMHRKHRQQVCRALQSLLRRAPVEAKLFTGCTPMETCRYREKGRLRLPMIFHTDQQ